jgi:hypothetical protein
VTARDVVERKRPRARAERRERAPLDRADRVLALQATAGNQAVTRLLRQPAPGPLAPAAARAAVADMSQRYGEDSIRLVQTLAGRPATGTFSEADAEAVAGMQQAMHATPNGTADVPWIDGLLKVLGTAAAPHSALIRIAVDRAKLDTSGVLGVEHDHTIVGASMIDSAPGVNTIRLGDAAFHDYRTLVGEIRKRLAVKPSGLHASAAPPEVLSDPAKQHSALALNSRVLDDPRSIRLLQGLLGAKLTGAWDVDLVRRVAAKQAAAGLSPSGIVGEPTVEALGNDLIARNDYDAVLRLIVDYYGLDASHALDIAFDANPPRADAAGETMGVGPAMGVPGIVRVFPLAFQQPWAGLVHVVAHELGHVQQVMAGVDSLNVREFLSRAIETESAGLPLEAIESDAALDVMIRGGTPSNIGFIHHAGALVHYYEQMTPAEKRAQHARFVQMRELIRTRVVSEGTPTQQAKLAPFIRRLERADAGVR